MQQIKENLDKIFCEISNGNNKGEKIHLVGATKTIDIDVINKAVSYGLPIVAENRVQEFRDKHDKILGAKQHFIGHLQTNKVKYLVGKVELIQSVDSFHLAQEIDRVAKNKSVIQDVLIEINIGGELSKSGFNPQNAIENIYNLAKLSNIRIKGLMTMLPKSEDLDYLRNLCLQMRNIYDKLLSDGFEFTYLSMGMSNDYKIAIQNGSNMIRLGTSIFGKRY